MKKQLFLSFGLGLFLIASLSACEVPNAPEGDGPTPEASSSPSASPETPTSSGELNQSRYVAAMKCAAGAESNQTLSRQFQQQADIVVNWPDDMWRMVGLMEGSAQRMMYDRAKNLDCAG